MRPKKIRPPAVAGSFYPADAVKLRSLINILRPKMVKTDPDIKALIVPHAGYIYSGRVASAGYAVTDPNHINHVILIGPSHHFVFAGMSQDTHSYWQTPLGQTATKPIKAQPPYLFNNSTHHAPEHSLEVQLPLLQHHLKTNFTITPLLISTPYHLDKLAHLIIPNITPNTLIVISSDLSHYYPLSMAQQKDQSTIQAILNLDLDTFLSYPDIEACGRYAIALLLILARLHNWRAKLISYDTSASASRDLSQVVGYASITFT